MEQKTAIRFSIIVVALNPGDKLKKTIDSILRQEYPFYEIVVKDGMSGDGSIEAAMHHYKDDRLKIYREPDKSIYEAMNQAVEKVTGDYILFLNCGDYFFDATVLLNTAERIAKEQTTMSYEAAQKSSSAEVEVPRKVPYIFYGNTYCEQTNVVVHSSPQITGFTCYRNIPCHQSCFYGAELFKTKKYKTDYRIRADYDHFLWCFYVARAKMIFMDMTIASYEGGGYSESKENQARDREEHKLITSEYMSKGELFRYKTIMLLTLAPLRRWMASNKILSGIYHKGKEILYHKRSEKP